MKKLLTVRVEGKHKVWGFNFVGDTKHLKEWRSDGLTINVLENTIPLFIQRVGLTRPWCKIQDIINQIG